MASHPQPKMFDYGQHAQTFNDMDVLFSLDTNGSLATSLTLGHLGKDYYRITTRTFNVNVVLIFCPPSNRLGGFCPKAPEPRAHLVEPGLDEEFPQSRMPENLAAKDAPTWEELAMELRVVMEFIKGVNMDPMISMILKLVCVKPNNGTDYLWFKQHLQLRS